MSGKWQRRFYDERDRRYRDIDRERRRATKLFIEQYTRGEKGIYATKEDLQAVAHELSAALTVGLSDLEARITAGPRRVWGYVTSVATLLISGTIVLVTLFLHK
jgi:hypothetical protein